MLEEESCDCLRLSAENASVQMGAEIALAERPINV